MKNSTFQCPPGSHTLPSCYSFLFDKSSVYNLSFGPKANSILITRDSEKRKYKLTVTLMNEEIQHFSVPLESTTCLATIHFHLTNLVSSYFSFLFDKSSEHSPSFESKANSIQVTTEGFQKSGKYKVTTAVTNEEIQHFSVPPWKQQPAQLLFILI